MSQGNESRFSATANYFVPIAGAGGGSTLNSTVLVNPTITTGVASSTIINNIATAPLGSLKLGTSVAHPSTFQVVEGAPAFSGAQGVLVADVSSTEQLGLSVIPAVGPNPARVQVSALGLNAGSNNLSLGSYQTPSCLVVNDTVNTGAQVNGAGYGINANVNMWLGKANDATKPNKVVDIDGYNFYNLGTYPLAAAGNAVLLEMPATMPPGIYFVVSTANSTNSVAISIIGEYIGNNLWSNGGGQGTSIALWPDQASGQLKLISSNGGAISVQLEATRFSGPVGTNGT